MSEKYYVVRQTEEGLTLREYVTAEKCMQAVADERELASLSDDHQPVFLDAVPGVVDGQRWRPDSAVLIIKGYIVKPKAKTRVIRWEID